MCRIAIDARVVAAALAIHADVLAVPTIATDDNIMPTLTVATVYCDSDSDSKNFAKIEEGEDDDDDNDEDDDSEEEEWKMCHNSIDRCVYVSDQKRSGYSPVDCFASNSKYCDACYELLVQNAMSTKRLPKPNRSYKRCWNIPIAK